jgi:hypothetical protein
MLGQLMHDVAARQAQDQPQVGCVARSFLSFLFAFFFLSSAPSSLSVKWGLLCAVKFGPPGRTAPARFGGALSVSVAPCAALGFGQDYDRVLTYHAYSLS